MSGGAEYGQGRPEPDVRGRRLLGKNAIVSGGSRGIGRAIVTTLAAEGAAVLFSYGSNDEAARETEREVGSRGGEAHGMSADAADEEAVARMVREAHSRWGRIDIAVSSAGVMYDSSIEETTLEEWHRVLEVNLTGAFLLARGVTPGMKKQRWGRIINISSQAAFTGSADHAHYGATKAGVLGFTYSAAKELGPYNVTVNAVTPGRIETDMLRARSGGRIEEWLKQIPLGRFGAPYEVAAAVAFLSTDEAGYISGANLNVTGGQLMG